MQEFSLIDPRAKLTAPDQTAYVQREVGDDGLVVLWDGQRGKWVILDRKAPGGPDASYVMIVQEPDGSFRPLDERTIKTLRKLRHHDVAREELIRAEVAHQRAIESRRKDRAAAFADDFRYFGKQITPSVGWRERSLAREAIRNAAK